MNKIECLEYFLYKVVLSYFKEKPDLGNDIGMLKGNKLFFFLCTIVTADGRSLLDISERMYATPLGYEDKDISTYIRNDKLKYFTLEINHITMKVPNVSATVEFFSKETMDFIDEAYDILLQKNKEIIFYSSTKLVDLQQTYFSWRYYFNGRGNQGTWRKDLSTKVPKEVILKEEKHYIHYDSKGYYIAIKNNEW